MFQQSSLNIAYLISVFHKNKEQGVALYNLLPQDMRIDFYREIQQFRQELVDMRQTTDRKHIVDLVLLTEIYLVDSELSGRAYYSMSPDNRKKVMEKLTQIHQLVKENLYKS